VGDALIDLGVKGRELVAELARGNVLVESLRKACEASQHGRAYGKVGLIERKGQRTLVSVAVPYSSVPQM
jgi:hypothetical protein